jgi:hypothetical protein
MPRPKDRYGSAVGAVRMAEKCLYLATQSLDPTGTGRTRWAMQWKPAINAFAITSATGSRTARDLLTQMLRWKHRWRDSSGRPGTAH